jgi:hypothetical protein
MDKPIVSLCLPTNGIAEWVFPVLDSIYNQGVSASLYEVIVTDNGDNEIFYKLMIEYASHHDNLIYKKTGAYMFDNQLEALKIASGLFFKFINHREVIVAGALEKIINIIEENKVHKPVIYFSNGSLEQDFYILNTFDAFIKTLRRYASWTSGVGIWKDDYEKIPKNRKVDRISPHSGILFSERKKTCYVIDNFVFSREITSDHTKKGVYDLFKAFGIEEFAITLNLFIDGDISIDTLKYVKKDYKRFVSELYWCFCIRKRPCSYDLTGFEDAMGIFFKKSDIIVNAYFIGLKKFLRKIKSIVLARK